MHLEAARRDSGHKGAHQKVERDEGRKLQSFEMCLCAQERETQRRAQGVCLKDERLGFGLPKCTMCSRETRKVHGIKLKAEGECFKALGCAHVIGKSKEGA